jgi:O-succinylbenzoic acid--CoA ligase
MVSDSPRQGRRPGPDPIGNGPADGVWDPRDLLDLARRRAASLRAQGLEAGRLVAVPERPAAELLLMQRALLLCRAALLPVRDGIGAEALSRLLAATGAEWLWQAGGPDVGRLVPTGHRALAPSLGGAWTSPLALVAETSGSSGAPRAVMLTAGNLLASADLVRRRLGLVPGDVWLCCLPLRHIGGLSIPYRCALAGANLLVHEGFHAERVAEDLARHGVTHLSLVPPMLARLLDLDGPPPPGLRVVLVGGQSLSGPLARRALERGWPLHLTYGMTETASQVACSDRLAVAPRPGVVGLPLAGLEIDCPGCPEPPRALRVRGPLVMAGYANPERIPGDGLEDGWLRTSDLACLDPGGHLRVLGRADEVLVTGGVKVHPARVEAVLASAPGVGEVALLGVPDPVWGQRLVAAYTGGAEARALDAWCREHLPGAERPRGFVRLSELPTLGSGKRDRVRLRELVLALGDNDGWSANERE